MKAEETVLINEEALNCVLSVIPREQWGDVDYLCCAMRVAAEIAKAQTLRTESMLKEQWMIAGRHEVIELLKIYNPEVEDEFGNFKFLLEIPVWQDKLKEWGLK